MSLVDVIVIAYNRVDCSRAFISSLNEFDDIAFRMIFVDNGSTDRTKLWASSHIEGKDIYVRNATNQYISAAWNQGLKLSTADHVAILNNDLVITQPGFLSDMVDAIDGGALCACPPNPGCPVGTFSGWSFMLSRECIEKIGLFDERFRLFYGDNDYARRIKKFRDPPAATVLQKFTHNHSQTIPTVTAWEEIVEEDRRRYFEKWGSA